MTKLPDHACTFTLTHDDCFNATDVERFLDIGGKIITQGYRLTVKGTLYLTKDLNIYGNGFEEVISGTVEDLK